MNQPKQTLESIQTDFDRIALLGEETWNHNAFYHDFLINRIPGHIQNALEIGCGTGAFSRLLAARAERVFAVDLSPQMIRLARANSKLYPNIDFVEGDVMNLQLPDNQFDCVATLTTLHHLPVEEIFRKIKKTLKPGGVFVCLDLHQPENFTDSLSGAAAFPASLLLNLIKTGKTRPPKDVRKAYDEHGKTDTYLTLSQIKRICADLLPNASVIKHFFWRYSIVWEKSESNG